MKTILFAIFGLICTLQVNAKPTIEVDHQNIYVRMPLQDFTQEEKAEATRMSVRLMQEKVAEMIEAGELPLDIISIEDLDKIEAATEQIVAKKNELDEYNDGNANNTTTLGNLVPTALIIGVGTKFSAGLGFSVGGSVSFGFVVLPRVTYMIPRHALSESEALTMTAAELRERIKESTSKKWVDIDWEIIAWPNVDIGGGVGFQAGVLRLSIGAIWGDMEDASDFNGLVLGGSANLMSVGGINVKAGFVYNPTLKSLFKRRAFKYAIVGFNIGAGAEAAARVNFSYIFAGKKALQVLGVDIDVETFSSESSETRQEIEMSTEDMGEMIMLPPAL